MKMKEQHKIWGQFSALGLLLFYALSGKLLMTLGVNIDKQAFLFLVFIICCLFAPAIFIAEYLDKRTAYLREVALTPVSEWPDMSVKEFFFCADLSPATIWEEDFLEYYNSHFSKGADLSVAECLRWSYVADKLLSGRDVMVQPDGKESLGFGLTANELTLNLKSLSCTLSFDETLIVR